MNERALVFQVEDETLLGVLHPSVSHAPTKGVLIVVGGPQYRVGSHRQFVLLARFLATRGIPVLRFDYRGMGDSTGARRDFERINADLTAALAAFQTALPSLRGVVIWGLCDAASAALLSAWRHPQIKGLILLNPWVRTEQGLAKAYLKHYYLRRLVDHDFWQGLRDGRVKPLASLRALLCALTTALIGQRGAPKLNPESQGAYYPDAKPLPIRMADGWRRFDEPMLLILSGADLTATEFREVAFKTRAWHGLLTERRVSIKELPEANHTFSSPAWRDQVALWSAEWVERLS